MILVDFLASILNMHVMPCGVRSIRPRNKKTRLEFITVSCQYRLLGRCRAGISCVSGARCRTQPPSQSHVLICVCRSKAHKTRLGVSNRNIFVHAQGTVHTCRAYCKYILNVSLKTPVDCWILEGTVQTARDKQD